jgi:hypothetical protein
MSNSRPVVDQNLSYDRIQLLDMSRLPREFFQAAALPPRQNLDQRTPRIFDRTFRLEKDPNSISENGHSWVSGGLPETNNQTTNSAEDTAGSNANDNHGLASDSADNHQLPAGNPGHTGDNHCYTNDSVGNNHVPSSLMEDMDEDGNSDDDDAWEAMNAQQSLPFHAVAASEEHPHRFTELAVEIMAAVATSSERAVSTSGLTNDIVGPNSEVDVDRLGELVAEVTDVSRENAPNSRRKPAAKRHRNAVAQVGSAENPGMTYGGRRKNANGS